MLKKIVLLSFALMLQFAKPSYALLPDCTVCSCSGIEGGRYAFTATWAACDTNCFSHNHSVILFHFVDSETGYSDYLYVYSAQPSGYCGTHI